MSTIAENTRRRGRDLLGMILVGQSDGAQLGHVRDLLFDPDSNSVLALVVSEKDLFGLIDAQIVPWTEVQSVGSDTVFVRGSQSKVPLKHHDEARRIAELLRESALSGTRILTSDGKDLGALADTVIDATTGRVLGYEVSGGFISDTLHGKKFLPQPPGLTIGPDVAVAPPQAAAELEKAPR